MSRSGDRLFRQCFGLSQASNATGSTYNVGYISVRLCLSTGIRVRISRMLFRSTLARQKVGSSGKTSLHCARMVPHGSTIYSTQTSAKFWENNRREQRMTNEWRLLPPKGASRSNVPWRVPNLFGFVCAFQQRQRQSHRSVFRWHDFGGEPPNELLQW